MLAQGASVVGGCAADCCAVVAPLPLRKPRRNAKLTGALRLWRAKTRFGKSKPNVAKTWRIRERSTQGLADHSRDTTLQGTISSRFGLKVTKLASRRSEHRNVVEMHRHFPQGRLGPMTRIIGGKGCSRQESANAAPHINRACGHRSYNLGPESRGILYRT